MKTLSLFTLVLIPLSILAQPTRTVDDILNQPEQKTHFYRLMNTYLDVAVINMSFGAADINSIMNKREIAKGEIYQIDVVFTDFPKNIDMRELNRRRILSVLDIRRDLVKDEAITWRLVRQMQCKNEAEAKLLFHGVVIYYRGEFTASLREGELGGYRSLPEKDDGTITDKVFETFKDSTVVATLRRNKWKNPTIIADVTGSMYPYMGQMTLWFLLKMRKKEDFNIVLFNDGDETPDHKKVIGKTEGIYNISTSSYEKYIQLMLKAVSGGYGGDIQENDIEAILKAQELYPDAQEYILIADNYSDMRDIELMTEIKHPVRVILCGSELGYNTQYLTLAYITGGSVHTLKEDMNDLWKKSNGDQFTLGGQRYEIKDGKVVKYNPSKR